MAQLGTLFATEGEVDKYFASMPEEVTKKLRADVAEVERKRRTGEPLTLHDFMVGAWIDQQLLKCRIGDRIADHIRSAPEREAAALERAKQPWVKYWEHKR